MHFLQANYLIDTIMPAAKPNTFKIAAAVARSTWGWNRECHDISLSDFHRLTGISSRETLTNAIQDALDSGFVGREEWANTFRYTMMHNPLNGTVSVPSGTETVPLYDNLGSTETVPTGTETVPFFEEIGTETVPPSYKIREEDKEKGEKKETPFPFQPNPSRSVQETPTDKRVTAVLEVCQMSADVPKHRSRAELAASQLKDVSAGYIRDRYGAGKPEGDWQWYADDWRGKKGERPTPEFVVETIYYTRQKAAVNGRKPAKLTAAADKVHEGVEW